MHISENNETKNSNKWAKNYFVVHKQSFAQPVIMKKNNSLRYHNAIFHLIMSQACSLYTL